MRVILLFLLMFNFSFAELKNVWATKDFLKNDIKIIDVRTPGEWRETGIVNGSYPIMFFDEQGRFNIPLFLKELNKVVKKDEQFALICRTGSRTSEISKFLSQELGYNVINLNGGIEKLMREGYKPVMYIPKDR
ncbi:rhodanese-like domain-containing protein [Sulfurovum sp. zt1-1]|uniref:Rhodanese-like domain-containing protein n=1 Tax=Sulfurovum zhangzhouensis TaxID=3019067 RepID=A0ABT7QVR2_9BACT|nr:rhodanese-like domain-containing protein [Sulfurovum zhangzhouensis]MDM5270929.1 rhodanese-like domain-containing protein [Sulfurovum zhangzhouensis]